MNWLRYANKCQIQHLLNENDFCVNVKGDPYCAACLFFLSSIETTYMHEAVSPVTASTHFHSSCMKWLFCGDAIHLVVA